MELLSWEIIVSIITTVASLIIIFDKIVGVYVRQKVEVRFAYRESIFAKEGRQIWLDFQVSNLGRAPIQSLQGRLYHPKDLDAHGTAGSIKEDHDPYWGGNKPFFRIPELTLHAHQTESFGVAFSPRETGDYPVELHLLFDGKEKSWKHTIKFPISVSTQ